MNSKKSSKIHTSASIFCSWFSFYPRTLYISILLLLTVSVVGCSCLISALYFLLLLDFYFFFLICFLHTSRHWWQWMVNSFIFIRCHLPIFGSFQLLLWPLSIQFLYSLQSYRRSKLPWVYSRLNEVSLMCRNVYKYDYKCADIYKYKFKQLEPHINKHEWTHRFWEDQYKWGWTGHTTEVIMKTTGVSVLSKWPSLVLS